MLFVDKENGQNDAAQSEIAGTKVVSFWSYLEFSNVNAYNLVAASDFGVSFVLSWDGIDHEFNMDPKTINSWAAYEIADSNDDDEDYGFYITVTGFAGLKTTGDLVVTPKVKTPFNDIQNNHADYKVSTTYTVNNEE